MTSVVAVPRIVKEWSKSGPRNNQTHFGVYTSHGPERCLTSVRQQNPRGASSCKVGPSEKTSQKRAQKRSHNNQTMLRELPRQLARHFGPMLGRFCFFRRPPKLADFHIHGNLTKHQKRGTTVQHGSKKAQHAPRVAGVTCGALLDGLATGFGSFYLLRRSKSARRNALGPFCQALVEHISGTCF